MHNLSNRKGTYALILFLGSRRRIRVGKLGIREFKRGYYVFLRQPLLQVFHTTLLNSGFDQQIRQFKAYSELGVDKPFSLG